MYTLISDDKKFTLSLSTLDQYDNSIIRSIKKVEDNKRIFIDKGYKIYVDICPKNMEHIVNYLRGYEVNYNNLSELEINRLRKDSILLNFIEYSKILPRQNIIDKIVSDNYDTIISEMSSSSEEKPVNLKKIFTNEELDSIESEIYIPKPIVQDNKCSNYHNSIKIMNDISTNKEYTSENQKHTESLYKKYFEESEAESEGNIFMKRTGSSDSDSIKKESYKEFVNSLYSNKN